MIPKPKKTEHTIVHSAEFPAMLLTYALRSQAFMEKAGSILKVEDFNMVNERAVMLGISICMDFWKKYRQLVSKDMFITQMGQRLSLDPQFLTEQECTWLVSTVVGAESIAASALHAQYMLDQFHLFVNERRLKPLAQKMLNAHPDAMSDLVEDIQWVKQTSRMSSGKVVDIFTPGREKFTMAPRIPTGVPFFDYLNGGGISLGECVGLLGPFGKGKTTLAVQLACEFARSREYTAYLSYETDIEPGLSTRMYGYIGGLSRTSIQGKQLHEIPPAILEKLRREEEAWAREYLLPVDMKQGSANAGTGGPDEVRAFLREQRDAGKPIKLVVLDQYLPMVNRYMAARNYDIKETRVIMQRLVQDFMDIAQPSEMNCCFVLLHQTTTTVVNAPSSRKPDAGDSAESKSWPWWMSSCFGLGTQDKNFRQWCSAIKGRDIPIKDVVIEMDGEHYRYHWDYLHPERYRAGNHGFIDTLSDNNENAIEQNPDMVVPAAQRTASQPPEVAY